MGASPGRWSVAACEGGAEVSELDGFSNANGTLMRRARRTAGRLPVTLLVATALLAAGAGDARAQLAISHWPHSPVRHPFRAADSSLTPSFTANLRGNFMTASNTLLTCPGNPTARQQRCRPQARAAGRGAVRRPQQQRREHAVRQRRPGRSFRLQHGDGDAAGGRAGVRAFLYWGADLARGVQATAPPTARPAASSPTTRPSPGPRRAPTRCGRPPSCGSANAHT